MKKNNKKKAEAPISEETANVTTVSQEENQPEELSEAPPETTVPENQSDPDTSPSEEQAVAIEPESESAPASSGDEVAADTQRPQLPKVQSTTVEPERQSDSEISYRVYMYQYIILSRPLNYREVSLLTKAFNKFVGGKDLFKRLNSYHVEEPDIIVLGDDGEQMKASVRCFEYSSLSTPIWRIKSHSYIKENEYREGYTLEIIIKSDNFWPLDTGTYDSSSLRTLFEDYIEESKKISPLLADIASCELRSLRYELYVPLGESDNIEVLKALYGSYSVPVDYCECETFTADSSKKRGATLMDTRYVKADVSLDDLLIIIDIQRRFSRNYSVKELMEDESPFIKMIITQMLSEDYAIRSALIYLMMAVIGGTYYSMKRAVEIVEASDMSDEGKGSLIKTLKLVAQHKRIHDAKLFFKDDSNALIEFNKDLHMLVELGINPVTIPKEHGIQELPNPIPNLYKRHVDSAEGGSRIEAEEIIGDLTVPCRIEV